jgi:hypothetical protein
MRKMARPADNLVDEGVLNRREISEKMLEDAGELSGIGAELQGCGRDVGELRHQLGAGILNLCKNAHPCR